MQNRGLSRQEADLLRLTVGLSGSAAAAADLEAATVGEVHEVFDSTCESFADEIRRSIDYYHSLQQDAPIARILISGEGALTRNMCDYLAGALHLPVALGKPAAVHRREQVEAPAAGARADRASSGDRPRPVPSKMRSRP